jgi:hypothetical protein
MSAKLPWAIWALRIVWLIWLAFWAEVAVGSWKELEKRAFAISLVVFVVSLLAGVGLWLKSRRG